MHGGCFELQYFRCLLESLLLFLFVLFLFLFFLVVVFSKTGING